jgi:hypothetical protein
VRGCLFSQSVILFVSDQQVADLLIRPSCSCSLSLLTISYGRTRAHACTHLCAYVFSCILRNHLYIYVSVGQICIACLRCCMRMYQHVADLLIRPSVSLSLLTISYGRMRVHICVLMYFHAYCVTICTFTVMFDRLVGLRCCMRTCAPARLRRPSARRPYPAFRPTSMQY